MGPVKVRPFIGRFLGQLTLSVAATLIATGLIAGLRSAPSPTTEPAAPQVASSEPAPPHPDLHLASMQEAFAMSHLGAMREEASAESREPARHPAQEQKPRAAAARPATASKLPAPMVISAPLPPVNPAQPAVAEQAEKPSSSLFGFVPKLPSPGKLVDKVASLGEKITSLAPWR
jgi:hypothetical protein